MTEITESELPGIEFIAPPVEETRRETTTVRKPGRPKGTVNQATLDKLRADLAESMVDLSAAIAVASPLAMVVIDERAEKTANAIVILAGGSPRLIAALKKTVKARAVVTIGETISAVSVAVMVDYNRMAPDSMIAQKFGVTEHYINAYPPDTNNGNGMPVTETRSGLFT